MGRNRNSLVVWFVQSSQVWKPQNLATHSILACFSLIFIDFH